MSITHHLVVKTLHTMFSFAHTSHIKSQSIPLQHTDSQISTLSSLVSDLQKGACCTKLELENYKNGLALYSLDEIGVPLENVSVY